MNIFTKLRGKNVALSQGNVSLRTRWLRGAVVGVLLQGVGLLLGFGSSVFIARLLGPQGLGQYVYVLAIVAVLSVFAAFGLPTTVLRLWAAYQAKENWALARGLLYWSSLIVGVLGLLLGLFLVIGANFTTHRDHIWIYIWAAPLIVALAWGRLRQRALQGIHLPWAAQLPEQIVKHSVFIAMCGALWFFGNQFVYRPEGIMAIWLFAGLSSFVAGVLLLSKLAPRQLHEADPQYSPRGWLAIAFPLYMADILGVIYKNTGTIILGLARTPEEVGLYQVALRLASLMLVMMVASNWVLSPWFSQLHNTGVNNKLKNVVTRTTKAIFGATAVLYILMIFFGKIFLEAFFGTEFIGAYTVLVILGTGALINIGCGPVVSLLSMTGGQRELMWTMAFVIVAHIVICLILVPIYGLVGIATSVAVSTAAYNLILVRAVKHRTGINATILG